MSEVVGPVLGLLYVVLGLVVAMYAGRRYAQALRPSDSRRPLNAFDLFATGLMAVLAFVIWPLIAVSVVLGKLATLGMKP